MSYTMWVKFETRIGLCSWRSECFNLAYVYCFPPSSITEGYIQSYGTIWELPE